MADQTTTVMRYRFLNSSYHSTGNKGTMCHGLEGVVAVLFSQLMNVEAHRLSPLSGGTSQAQRLWKGSTVFFTFCYVTSNVNPYMMSMSKLQVKFRIEGQSRSQSVKNWDFICIKTVRDAVIWVSELGSPLSFSDIPVSILLGDL